MGWFVPALLGAAGGFGASQLFGRGGGNEPEAPQFRLPDWAEGLPPEILQYIRQGAGKQLAEPLEYGISSQALQNMLQYQPGQFQYPIADIQKALEAQQALQLQEYQNQIRPILGQQGQLDSTYYANLLGKYLQGQQAQTYGTTADLLTQQALTNLDISKWLPQFQSGIAGQLTGLGGQRSNIGQFNLQYPYQTYIPALQQMYGTGLQQAGLQYNANLAPYQQQLQQYQADKAQQQAIMSALGSLAISAATGGIGGAMGLYGTGVGAGQGALLGLTGFTPGLSQLLGKNQLQTSLPSNIDLSGLSSSLYDPRQFRLRGNFSSLYQ